jgi:hypothetical protein
VGSSAGAASGTELLLLLLLVPLLRLLRLLRCGGATG